MEGGEVIMEITCPETGINGEALIMSSDILSMTAFTSRIIEAPVVLSSSCLPVHHDQVQLSSPGHCWPVAGAWWRQINAELSRSRAEQCAAVSSWPRTSGHLVTSLVTGACLGIMITWHFHIWNNQKMLHDTTHYEEGDVLIVHLK